MTDQNTDPTIRSPQDYFIQPLAPRRTPLASPLPVEIFDAPYVCLKVNRKWFTHVLGVLDVLAQYDAWQGTDDEKQAAVDQIEYLIQSAESGCEEMPANYIRDIDFCTGETPGIVTVYRVVDGVETPQEYSLAQCLKYVESISCFSSGLTVGTNNFGVFETEDIDFIECGIPVTGAPGAPGADGADGEDGAPGAPGAPGADGEDCECLSDDPTPPATISDEATACGTANYIVNWLDARFDDSLEALEAAVTVSDAVSDYLGLIPGVGTIVSGVIDAFEAIGAVLPSVLRSDVSSVDLENWKCELYCLMGDDATFDATLFNTWIDSLRLTHSAVGEIAWFDFAQAFSDAEIQKRGNIGAATPSAECSTLCDCGSDPGLPCDGDLIDLKTDNTTYVRRQSFVSAFHYGNWVSGQGWEMADGYNPSNGATTTPPGLIITRDYGATPVHIRYVHVTIKAKIAMSTSRVVQCLQVSNEAGTTIGTTLSENTGTRAANEVFTLTFEFTNAALNHYENTIRISAPATIAEMYVQEIQVECW